VLFGADFLDMGRRKSATAGIDMGRRKSATAGIALKEGVSGRDIDTSSSD
jgi:hypothetical protein